MNCCDDIPTCFCATVQICFTGYSYVWENCVKNGYWKSNNQEQIQVHNPTNDRYDEPTITVHLSQSPVLSYDIKVWPPNWLRPQQTLQQYANVLIKLMDYLCYSTWRTDDVYHFLNNSSDLHIQIS